MKPGSPKPSDIRSITAAQARQLRHTVLRPHQKPEELIFRGDDDADALHVGAFEDDKLIGIASVAREEFPGEPQLNAWRLRGMATAPEARRMGYGAALVRALIAHVAARGGNLVWCHGRASALPFYRALGFREHGEEFDVPVTGPHFVLRRAVLPENQDPKGLRASEPLGSFVQITRLTHCHFERSDAKRLGFSVARDVSLRST